jgi:SAM-dependent methyltransferase
MGARVSDAWRAMSRGTTGKWSVWKFNWLANHKIIRALECARPHVRGRLLDVGCGSRPFAAALRDQVTQYIGTDLNASPYFDTRPPDIRASADGQPFRDASMDTVLGLSVLTYLTEPLGMIEEAYRVLKPGGMLLLEFTQMVPLHDAPYDYFRFTRFGAQYLLERAGFEPVEYIPIGGLWARVGLSTIAALNRINRGPIRVLTEIPVRLLYVVLQLGFELLDRLWFDPNEVLAHLVVAKKPHS